MEKTKIPGKAVKVDQALKAIKEGRTVVSVWKENVSEYVNDCPDYQVYLGELLEGKWYILSDDDSE